MDAAPFTHKELVKAAETIVIVTVYRASVKSLARIVSRDGNNACQVGTRAIIRYKSGDFRIIMLHQRGRCVLRFARHNRLLSPVRL